MAKTLHAPFDIDLDDPELPQGGNYPAFVIGDDAVGREKVISFASDVQPCMHDFSAVEVLGVLAVYTASATVGTRQIALDILSAADEVLYRVMAAGTLTASQKRWLTFGQGLNAAASVGGALTEAGGVNHEVLPRGLRLGQGMKLRVRDVSGSNEAGVHSGDQVDIVVHFAPPR